MLPKLPAALLLMTLAAAQTGGGTLRIRVQLLDVSGAAIPMPRLVLLVSDNPATAEPRRVRTDNNGMIELKLAPGSYTVESDRPVAFLGKAYSWTQIVNVAAGRDTVVDLTAKNAESETVTTETVTTAAAAPVVRSSAVLLS